MVYAKVLFLLWITSMSRSIQKSQINHNYLKSNFNWKEKEELSMNLKCQKARVDSNRFAILSKDGSIKSSPLLTISLGSTPPLQAPVAELQLVITSSRSELTLSLNFLCRASPITSTLLLRILKTSKRIYRNTVTYGNKILKKDLANFYNKMNPKQRRYKARRRSRGRTFSSKAAEN